MQPIIPDVDGALHWLTMLPPRGPDSLDEKARHILDTWGWLDENGAWLGWAWTRGPKWWQDPPDKGKGRGRDRGRSLSMNEVLQRMEPENYWRTIQLAPEGPPSLEGRRAQDSPVSALGLLLATACAEVPEQTGHESRGCRLERQARAYYMQRHFCADPDMAARRCMCDPSSILNGRFGANWRSPMEPLAHGVRPRSLSPVAH